MLEHLKSTSSFRCAIPLTFLSEDYRYKSTCSYSTSQPEFAHLWTSLNVTREQIEHSWETWSKFTREQMEMVCGKTGFAHLEIGSGEDRKTHLIEQLNRVLTFFGTFLTGCNLS